MCLITSQTKPLIADKDITCYKLLKKGMHSCCYDFTWELGQLYHSRIEVEYSPYEHSTVIQNAFHTYAFCDTVKRAYCSSACASMIVKCTIPKGAVYYCGMHTGDDYGFASNQLIVNEVISVKELYPDFDWDHYPYEEGQVIKYKKSHYEIWEDYQIMNIQPHPLNNICVDLIVKKCDDSNIETTIGTTFDGKGWRGVDCFIR